MKMLHWEWQWLAWKRKKKDECVRGIITHLLPDHQRNKAHLPGWQKLQKTNYSGSDALKEEKKNYMRRGIEKNGTQQDTSKKTV
jgi:hypothetical protein